MAKFIKIFLISCLILLVVFAAMADRFAYPDWIGGLNLTTYLRLVSLLGLMILLFFTIGYRQKIIQSQKYRRAQEVVVQAESDAARKQRSLEQVRDKLEAEYKQKEQESNDQIEHIKAECNEKLLQLKEQNIKLKETVSRLMNEIKRKKE